MSAADSCLQNPLIIQKILNHSDFMENMKLRLFNTSFNSEVLHRIRRTHRSIRMEIPDVRNLQWISEYGEEIRGSSIVHVNDQRVENILSFIRFLKYVVNVKVEHFVMRNFWASLSNENWRKRLHDEIHRLLENQQLKTFVGMYDLCDEECSKCNRCAITSFEYGPLQSGVDITISYFTLTRNVHFSKLIIDERYLHDIASIPVFFAIRSAKARDEHMDEFLASVISCDQLSFKISELLGESEQRLATRPLPLELIEKMCDVWKADSIVIELNSYPEDASTEEMWSDKGKFTPFRFDELYEEGDKNPDKKERKFSSVTIDMRNTRNIYAEVTDGSIGRDESYSNLIANVRRVFPTDKISIVGQLLLNPTSRLIIDEESFENILKSVWKNPGHLEVTIQHNVPITATGTIFEIPDSIDILGRRLQCTLLPERITSREECIGRRYRITDESSDKTLNLEFFILKSRLRGMMRLREKNNMGPMVKGFWRHHF